MKKKAALLFSLFVSIHCFSQHNDDIEFGVGVNVAERDFNRSFNTESTNLPLNIFLGYEHTFEKNISTTIRVNYTDFEGKYFENTGEARQQNVGINFGVFYHYLKTKKIDLSTGYYLGYHFKNATFLDTNNKSNYTETDGGISLIKLRYFFLNNFGFSGEFVVGTTLYSNVLFSFTYRLN